MHSRFRTRINSDFSEIVKRKREVFEGIAEESKEIFQKSKKTTRSPIKREITIAKNIVDQEENPEKMEEMKKMLEEVIKNQKELTKNNKEIKEELKEIKEEVKKNSVIIAEIEVMQKQFQEKEIEWNKEKQELNKRIQLLEKRMEEQEKRKRSNNIIIKGLKIDNNRPKDLVQEFLAKELGIDRTIKQADIIKQSEDSTIIKIETNSAEDKEAIMKKKSKLKGTKIFIDNDYTPDERKMHAVIRKQANEERLKGKTVKIFYNKLSIDNKYYAWNYETGRLEEKMPQDQQPSTAKN